MVWFFFNALTIAFGETDRQYTIFLILIKKAEILFDMARYQVKVCVPTSLAARCGHVITFWPVRWKSCWVSLERLLKTRLNSW